MTRYTHLTRAAARVECRVTLATHKRQKIVRQYIGSEQEHAPTASYHRFAPPRSYFVAALCA
eukprot:265140-Prymnesium_polylepis.1